MAAGFGQFVLSALRRGFDCEGLEPDRWRLDFIDRRMALVGDPAAWQARFHRGLAEELPFADDSFDYVTSFQTLEHVQDPERAVAEMVRVTRPGGAIHIMCPDYRSTFEAHYQLPWLPLFPRPLARMYLRLLGRPTKGLDTIKYVTRPRIGGWVAKAEMGKRFLVFDEDRVLFQNGLRRRRLPDVPGAYSVWRAWTALRFFGRRELSVSMLIRVVEK
jgi:ubiquinone/menaquinone biosynthesis C-methylase UbiE